MLEQYYHGEFDYQGQAHTVLDAKALYRDRRELDLKKAVRTEPVYLWFPKAGDQIVESGREAVTAKGTETVFIKKLDASGIKLKVYIPSGTHGPLTEEVLDEKYQPRAKVSSENIAAAPIAAYLNQHSLDGNAEFYIREPRMDKAIDILHEAIDRRAIILNARGEGKHQALVPGDSLKFEDDECLPLPKAELDTAWKLIENKYPPADRNWVKK